MSDDQEHPTGPWKRNKTVTFQMTLKDVVFKTVRESSFERNPDGPADSNSDSVTTVSGEITGSMTTKQDGENDFDFADPDEQDEEKAEAWKNTVVEALKQILTIAKQFGDARTAPKSPFETT